MKTRDENKTKKTLQTEGKTTAGSKSPMKKRRWLRRGQLILSWSFAAIIFIAFGAVLYLSKNKQAEVLSELKMEKTELILQLDDRDNLIDDMVTTFNEIETDLMRITEKENMIEFETGDMEYNRTKKEKIIDNISYINTLLDDNKKRISYLNKRLKDSGLKMSSLEQKIVNLEQSLLSRDSSITLLKQVLEQKNYEMAQLNQRLEQKDLLITRQNEVIDYQNSEKLIAYTTTGNYKELEEKGVLTKERGFLFFGKETVLQNEFPTESFEEVNILETKYITLHGRKATVITSHPKDSYVFVKDSSEMLAYLEITDPNAFWRVSKYAVIETR